MPNYSKSLLIFALFAVLWLENKAHHCDFPHEKTHKKFGEGKTSSTTPKPAIKFDSKCNTSTVPSCQCDSLYYPVPKSGNCTDVFKRLPTTPDDVYFLEENCYKVQRPVCRADLECLYRTPPPYEYELSYEYEFPFGKNISEPFCQCGDHPDNYPVPESGNCTDLETTYEYARQGLSCHKMQTLCTGICYCNSLYVDPTKCNPQTCNNASDPFCNCSIAGDHYLVPESGNCMDVIKQFSTTPTFDYGYCYKARTVCRCEVSEGTQCECKEECVSGCPSW